MKKFIKIIFVFSGLLSVGDAFSQGISPPPPPPPSCWPPPCVPADNGVGYLMVAGILLAGLFLYNRIKVARTK